MILKKYLLRLDFSNLNDHEFRHNFKDSINPICSGGKYVEYVMLKQHLAFPELYCVKNRIPWKLNLTLKDLPSKTVLNVLFVIDQNVFILKQMVN